MSNKFPHSLQQGYCKHSALWAILEGACPRASFPLFLLLLTNLLSIYLFISERVSLCSPDLTGTYDVVQARLEIPVMLLQPSLYGDDSHVGHHADLEICLPLINYDNWLSKGSFEKRDTWLKDGNCVHQLLRIWLRQGLTLLFSSVQDSPENQSRLELVMIFLIMHPKYWDSGIYHHAWQPTRSKFKRLKLFWGSKHRDPSFLFA